LGVPEIRNLAAHKRFDRAGSSRPAGAMVRPIIAASFDKKRSLPLRFSVDNQTLARSG
jgi:hypothetical protein